MGLDVLAIGELLAAGATRYGVPGVQLGLLRGDDRVVLCHGLRAAGGTDPVMPTTPFHAGSIAKALAATLALDAHARGELDLDLPADAQGVRWPETPRTLMTHTSGRPNVLPDPEETRAAFADRVGAMPLVHAPGRFSYSNAVWPVVDLLLEHATGRDFETLAGERVLGPLGLDARFGPPAGGAVGHAVAGPGDAPQAAIFAGPAAASAAGTRWWATADELLTFASLHLHAGADVIAPAAVAAQRETRIGIPGRTFADGWATGWATWDRGDYRATGWSGYTTGHRAYLRVLPEHDAAIVLLTNCAGPLLGGAGGSALWDNLAPACLAAVGVGEPGPVNDHVPGRAAEALAGPYGPVTITATGPDALLLEAPAMGVPPVPHARRYGDTFAAAASASGGMPIAFDEELLYLGPFALPRSGTRSSAS